MLVATAYALRSAPRRVARLHAGRCGFPPSRPGGGIHAARAALSRAAAGHAPRGGSPVLPARLLRAALRPPGPSRRVCSAAWVSVAQVYRARNASSMRRVLRSPRRADRVGLRAAAGWSVIVALPHRKSESYRVTPRRGSPHAKAELPSAPDQSGGEYAARSGGPAEQLRGHGSGALLPFGRARTPRGADPRARLRPSCGEYAARPTRAPRLPASLRARLGESSPKPPSRARNRLGVLWLGDPRPNGFYRKRRAGLAHAVRITSPGK